MCTKVYDTFPRAENLIVVRKIYESSEKAFTNYLRVRVQFSIIVALKFLESNVIRIRANIYLLTARN
jgi:hypothetical protein